MFAELKVGDEVAYNMSGRRPHPIFSKVVKVGKSYVEVENGRRFSKKSGAEVKSSTSGYPMGVLWNLEAARTHGTR